VLDWLVDLATSEWAYLVSAVIILLDTFVGVLPAETVLHGAGVGAARGESRAWLLIVIAALAAIAADLLAYTVEAKWGTTLRDKFIRSDRLWSTETSRRRFGAVRDQRDQRPWILTIGRFVPGLRTLAVFGAGSLDFPRRRFLAYEAPGALAWAAYNVLLGYFLGLAFRDSPFWVAFAISAGIALGLTVVFELVRRAKLNVATEG